MSAVTLTLTDVDGAMESRLDFGPEGFQKDSHAHQHALILHRRLDELCRRLDEPQAKTGIVLPNGEVV